MSRPSPARAGLAALARLGRSLGRDRLLVQAGGGNASVKLGSRMAIKASGARLSALAFGRGIALADPRVIVRGLPALRRLRSTRARELGYAALLGRSGRTPGRRVSMEAGLHAVIPEAFVCHVHSVAGIAAGLRPGPERRRLFREALGGRPPMATIGPCLPGMELTARIQDRALRSTAEVRLWVLRNHGLVWGARDAAALARSSARFEEFLRRSFRLDRFPRPHRAGAPGCRRTPASLPDPPPGFAWSRRRLLCFCAWPACRLDLLPRFPDFIVYFDLWGPGPADLLRLGPRLALLGAGSARELKDKEEVLDAHVLVASLAGSGGARRVLPRRMIRDIKSLETERLRLAQIRRDG